jgi:hypothetical protein
VLADIILMAPPDDQSTLMADILANLGSFLLEKKEDADPTRARTHKSKLIGAAYSMSAMPR